MKKFLIGFSAGMLALAIADVVITVLAIRDLDYDLGDGDFE